MFPNPSGISVFFPALNDQATIATMVAHALDVLPTLTDDYEVIVVNDGSVDATPAILDELARKSSNVKVVHHVSNRGYGAALRSGFDHATKELVFYTDGDGQYDVRELAALVPLMTENCSVVNGYKIRRSDARYRVIAGALYNRLVRLCFRIPIRDVDCDFRLIRRRALQQIRLFSSSGIICVELVHKLNASGSSFVEAPIHHYPRAHGRSQFFTFRRVARTFLDFFSLWIKLVLMRPNVHPS